MHRVRSFFYTHKTILISMGFLVLFSVTVARATPPTSPYNAGTTLDPQCAPGSPNCTVQANPWVVTGNNISYGLGTVSIGSASQFQVDATGAVTAPSINGNIITAGSGTLTLAAGKTFTASNTLTLAGTDGSVLTLGGNLTTSGAFATTLTVTGNTTVTLPTTGTLYGTATNSISSAQLAASLSDETGTGAAVFATSPTFVTPVLGAASATNLTINGTAGAGTINLLGQSVTPAAPAVGTQLVYADASGRFTLMGSNGFSAALSKSLLTANQIYSFPNASGTFALAATTLAGYGITDAAPLSGGTNYIQNQTATAQVASFSISGNGNFGGNVGIGTTTTSNLLTIQGGGINLNGGSTAAEQVTYGDRVGVGIPVPNVQATAPHSQIAFDIVPTPGATDFSGTSNGSGVAWIDLCDAAFASACNVQGNANYESTRVGIMADGVGYIGSTSGGTGVQHNFSIQPAAGNVGIGTGFGGAVPFLLTLNSNSTDPTIDFQLSSVDKGYLGIASTTNRFFNGAATGDISLRGAGGNILIGSNATEPNPTITVTPGSPGTVTIAGTLTNTGLAAGSAGNFVVNGGSGLLVTRTASQVLTDIGAAPLSGGGNYIQNQTATAQVANFNISGNGFVGGNVDIGTTASIAKLFVSEDGATPNSALYNSVDPIIMSNSAANTVERLITASTGGANSGFFTAISSRGTLAAPLASASGDVTGTFMTQGYDGTARQSVASIAGAVDAAVSSGIIPGRLVFSTTNASGTLAERMRIDSSGNVGIGTTSPSGRLTLAGSQTAAAWGLNGINFQTVAATYTDSTTSSATVANMAVNSFGIPTLAATNVGATYTNAATLYIAGAPVAGTNAAITNPLAFDVAGGKSSFGGNVGIGTTTPTAQLTLQATASNAPRILINDGNGAELLRIASDSLTNVFIGSQAGLTNNAGGGAINDTFVGNATGKANTTGSSNTVFGNSALFSNQTTSNNTAIGSVALNALNTGGSNTGVGLGAFQALTSGTGNTGLGLSVMNSATSGSYNTALGDSAMQSATSGSYNIALGAWVQEPSLSGSGQLNIGNVLYGTGLYQTASDSSIPTTNGAIGIGTTATSSLFSLGGNRSAPAWGISGINFQTAAATYTDSTTATATVASMAVNSFGIPTIAASNAGATYTNAANLYIAGAPAAGTNVTLTNPYALDVASGTSFFGTNPSGTSIIANQSGGSTAAIIVQGSGGNSGPAFQDNRTTAPALVTTKNDSSTTVSITNTGSGGAIFASAATGIAGQFQTNGTSGGGLAAVFYNFGSGGLSTISDVVEIGHNNATANGGGTAIVGVLQSSTNVQRKMSRISNYWINNANGAETGALGFDTITSGTLSRVMTLTSGSVGIGTSSPSGLLTLAGSQTAAAWGLNGIDFQTVAANYNDTTSTSSATVANMVVNSFGIPTLSATNSGVTYTNAATLYVAGAPTAGTNATITNPLAFDVAGGKSAFGGNVGIGTTTPSAPLTVAGPNNSGIVLRQNTSIDRFSMFVGNGSTYVADENYISNQNTNLHIMAGVAGTTEIMTLLNNGSIGIGTTSPGSATKLQVAGGGALFTGGSPNPGDGTPAGVRVGYFSTGDYGFIQADQTAVTAKNLILEPAGGTGATGNVGIGMNSPAFSSNASTFLAVGNQTVNGFSEIGSGGNVTGTTSTVGVFAFVNTSLVPTEKRIAAIVGNTDGATNSGSIDFYTSNAGVLTTTSKMHIDHLGNVGIGTSTPTSKLDITSLALGGIQSTTTSGLSLNNSTAAALGAQQVSPSVRWTGQGWGTTAGTSQAVSFRSYVTPVQGTVPTGYLGFGSSINGGAYNDGQLILTSAGFVGIANTTPGFLLSVGSSSTLTGTTVAEFANAGGTCDVTPSVTGGILCTSDMTLKKNITDLADNSTWSFNSNIAPASQSVLDKIMALTPVDYNWNVEQDTDPKHAGFIAQEVKQVFPDLVTTNPNTGLLSLNYTGLIPYTVEAIQEMNLNITNLDDVTKTNTLRDKLESWLASATNGIQNIFSQQVTTPTLCVGTNTDKTCITKAQLDQLLQQQGTSSSSSGGSTSNSGGSSAGGDTTTNTGTDSSAGDTQSQQTPPPADPTVTESPQTDPVTPTPPDNTQSSDASTPSTTS